MKEKTLNFLNSFKLHSKAYLKTNVLFMTFVLTSVINGCLIRFFTVKNYFDIKPLIADLAVVLVIGALGYLIKPKHQFKYFITWSVIFSALCIINSMYYTNYLSFASFSLLETSLQIAEVSDAIVDNVMELKDFIFLWQIIALIIVNSRLKKKNYFEKVSKIEKGKVRALNTLVAAACFAGLFISTLTSVDVGRLYKQWNREYVVMKFGIYTYQFNDLIATVKSTLNPLFGYDENNKKFREYFDARGEDTLTNEYTDIFKGKNVIMIHGESIQQYVLDLEFNGEYVAPNLRRLASEGLYFSNFHSQESSGTSSDTEFTLNTSIMPASSGTVFVSYFDREYPTIEKKLKEQNYYTFSMHGNNCTFWNRQAAHKSFGYDNFYCYTKDYTIDETIGLGLSDKSFFKQSVPILKKINEEHSNWFGTMIMLTNHTPFTWIDEYSDYEVTHKFTTTDENGNEVEKVANYMEGTKLGSYFKSVHYADEALGELIDNLDKEGLLENTVFILYGDHDAKLKKSEFNRLYNYDFENDEPLSSDDPNYDPVDYFDYELNRAVPLIVWTKDSKDNEVLNKEVKKVMGMYDVMPTLGNMMGFKNKYAVGHDIFSIDENVVVFPDGNWLTDKMYYSQSKGEGRILNIEDTISEDYITKFNKIADEAISVSNSIIIYDLIKKNNQVVGAQ